MSKTITSCYDYVFRTNSVVFSKSPLSTIIWSSKTRLKLHFKNHIYIFFKFQSCKLNVMAAIILLHVFHNQSRRTTMHLQLSVHTLTSMFPRRQQQSAQHIVGSASSTHSCDRLVPSSVSGCRPTPTVGKSRARPCRRRNRRTRSPGHSYTAVSLRQSCNHNGVLDIKQNR